MIHSDFSKRINAGVNLDQNSDAFDVEAAITITTGNVSLFAAMSIPLDFKGSAGQSFLYECPPLDRRYNCADFRGSYRPN